MQLLCTVLLQRVRVLKKTGVSKTELSLLVALIGALLRYVSKHKGRSAKPYQNTFRLAKVFLPTTPDKSVCSNGSWKQQITHVKWL